MESEVSGFPQTGGVSWVVLHLKHSAPHTIQLGTGPCWLEGSGWCGVQQPALQYVPRYCINCSEHEVILIFGVYMIRTFVLEPGWRYRGQAARKTTTS